jgi:hypothetical protein
MIIIIIIITIIIISINLDSSFLLAELIARGQITETARKMH